MSIVGRLTAFRTQAILFGAVLAMAAAPARCEVRNPLGEGFEYDLGALRRVDPALVLFEEHDPVRVPLREPAGLAVDAAGRLIVVGDGRLVVLDRAGRELRSSQLAGDPTCVAADPDGTLFVGLRDRLQVLPGVDEGATPGLWESLGERARVTGLAAGDDQVWVADAGQRIVHTFSKSGKRGPVIGEAGSRDEPPHFIVPSPFFDVGIGPDETLWVVNPGRHRVENYRADGTPVSSWGQASMRVEGFCGCCNPSHLAVRRDGSFITSEKGLVRVKLYGPTGEFRGVVAPPDAFDEGTVGLDLAADADGDVLVLDAVRRQIRVFRQKVSKP